MVKVQNPAQAGKGHVSATRVALVAHREDGEDWREAAARAARAEGLDAEVLEAFDQYVTAGYERSRACWMALYDWDCLVLGEVSTEADAAAPGRP